MPHGLHWPGFGLTAIGTATAALARNALTLSHGWCSTIIGSERSLPTLMARRK